MCQHDYLVSISKRLTFILANYIISCYCQYLVPVIFTPKEAECPQIAQDTGQLLPKRAYNLEL